MAYNDKTPSIISSNESRMALLFLLDTSVSLCGKKIESLNEGINKFKEAVCKDKTTRKTLDVSIVEFNSIVRVVQPWCPISNMEPINLKTSGSTNMEYGLRTAIEMVRERSHFYYESIGTTPYTPWIVMITDGYPDNPIDSIADEISELVEHDKLRLWTLAVEGADTNVLKRLSGKRSLILRGYDFTDFFDWVNKSMRSISVSVAGTKAKGVDLPVNVDKNTDDLM